jgi:hypothetical protein
MLTEQFKSGSKWYFITPEGKVDSFTIHSGLSPASAVVLSKVLVVYPTWKEANEALIQFNKEFTYFK